LMTFDPIGELIHDISPFTVEIIQRFFRLFS
jgi:hypothetical protein